MNTIYIPDYSMCESWGFLTPSLDFIKTDDVRVISTLSSNRALVVKCEKYGYVNQGLHIAIEPIYDFAHPFFGRYAEVEHASLMGIIDLTGREVIPLAYDATFIWDTPLGVLFGAVRKNTLTVFDESLSCLFSTTVDSPWDIYCPNNGAYFLFIIKKDGIFRWMTFLGKEILAFPRIQEVTGFFCGGLWFVKDVKNHWGALNLTGECALDFSYESVGRFPIGEDAWCVCRNGKWGIINVTGNVEVDFMYDRLTPEEEGLILASQNDKWGLISRSGHVVFPFVKTDFGHAPRARGAFLCLDLPERHQTHFFLYSNITEPYKILENDFRD